MMPSSAGGADTPQKLNKRILMVDDEPANLTLLGAILAPLGCETVEASNGVAALEAMQREPFDLVLLDLMMPVMDGLETLRNIRQRDEWASTPVVMVTAAHDREARMSGFEAGADEFLEKPIDRSLLMTRVRTLLRLRDARQQAAERGRVVDTLSQERRELVNLIIHDLKNPLSVIHANLNYVESFLPPTTKPELREALLDAATASERMKGLIGDILDVERMDRTELKIRRQELNVVSLVEEVARAHRREAALQNQQLDTFCRETAVVKADGDLIRRVMENLVENALHHTPPNGRIELQLEAGDELAIMVSNTGTPIADTVREHLFERFGRGDGNTRHRFGLGLYFCKRVATAHDGSMLLVDRPGWSVSFRFAVPNA